MHLGCIIMKSNSEGEIQEKRTAHFPSKNLN